MNTEDLTRRLPFTVRPGHRENLDSYGRRTLGINGLQDRSARELLARARQHDPATTWASLLSAKTGRPLDRLVAAPPTAIHEDSDACRTCASLLPERWACTLCHQGAHVQQHPHLDDFVCERHRRWTGPGSTPATQGTVSVKTVAAHRKLRELRRKSRVDIELLLALIASLRDDLRVQDHEGFRYAVAVMQWLTRRDTLVRLFDPAPPYASTFAWMSECITNLVRASSPATARAVWLHLHPAHLSLQVAFRGYSGYHARHSHEFALPTDVTDWYPRPETFQSWGDYLACTGDTNIYQFDDDSGPTLARPRRRRAYCDHGHAYMDITVNDDESGARTPCPTCTRRHVMPGVNDLRTVNATAAEQLHPTLNGDLTAEDISVASSRPVWWLCTKGHPYTASPSNRTLNDSGCAVCLNRVVRTGVNDLATTNPGIARELHPSSVRRQSASTFTATDTKLRLWLCPGGHEFKATAWERTRNGKSCKRCKQRRTRASGRSLADTHPQLAATWLPELNEGRDPGDCTKGSRLSVVWWCEAGHPFLMRLEARTRGCGCPYCAGRLLLAGFNDFATTHPDLATDWHPYKNRKDPNQVMAGSTTKFEWRCKDGHETSQSIPNRRKSHGCTECSPQDRVGHARFQSEDIQRSAARRRTSNTSTSATRKDLRDARAA
ncbi:zinc-ribbon domain-containing protein [Microbacterium lushaniae]|uniref:Treble clef zinc finger domain-containing protein n=1 Tax=Microbacterium lushaniae TaxID=2614639 RepID=A0A5J6L7G0_9MICO|nr:zinc-ribbon domain-containing protein [Microbacterium lushaniae]QEW04639.1 hypothetical protein F6J85_17140 [Microbacterium lushaniae]